MAALATYLEELDMILHRLPGAAFLVGLMALALLPEPPAAPACAVAVNQSVEIADESAIIIWDANTKTQHFIRRATFNTTASDLGFLVPTPSKPTLTEADDKAFAELATITAPKIVKETRPSTGPGCGCGTKVDTFDKAPAASADVHVLEEQRIAGYDTAILEADDADALGKWLKAHDYVYSPRLVAWVAPYVKAGWKITAFKFAKKAATDSSLTTSAVRMTFETKQPVFPYREPEEEKRPHKEPPARLLRVFFLSDRRMDGTLGEKGQKWPGQTVWANKLTTEQRGQLLKQLNLPADSPPATWWLTEFEDHSSPRPGTDDVYFAPSADQSTVERPPHIIYVSRKVPDCIMCYALAAYMLVPWLVRSVRRKNGEGRTSDLGRTV
jgi:hypothetical protein